MAGTEQTPGKSLLITPIACLWPPSCAEPEVAHTANPHPILRQNTERLKLMRVWASGHTLLTLNLETAPRCCGTWQSVVWRAQAQRLWQKAWPWCEGPRACLRTAQRRRELRS